MRDASLAREGTAKREPTLGGAVEFGQAAAASPIRDHANRKAKLALPVGLAMLLLSGAALVGEVAVRYAERHRASVPGTTPLLFYPHIRQRYALVRDYDYFGWIHVNGQGFRGPDVRVEKSPGVVRIMAVGSSTTFDRSVSRDEAAWPARLQYWLQQLAPSRQVEVINAGVPGYGVLDDVIRLETELYRYRPDVVILYEGHNDLFGALRLGVEPPRPQPKTPGEITAVTPWGYWLSRHSLLYAKIVARIGVLKFAAGGRRALRSPRSADPRVSAVAIDSGALLFERDLTSFLAIARSLGIRVVIPELVHVSGVEALNETDASIRRSWTQAMPFVAPEAVLRGYGRFNAVLRDMARRFGAIWVPTESFGLAGAEWYDAGDPIHFNDRGADRMGRQVAGALLAGGAMDSLPALPGGTRRPAAERR
jgi:lysophospholipase L1-like esterase